MKRPLALIIPICLLLLSCTKSDLENHIMIRIDNQSGKKIDQSSVFSFSHNNRIEWEKKYGTILPGTTSRYKAHQEVWSNHLLFRLTVGSDVIEVRDIRCGLGAGSAPTRKILSYRTGRSW